MKETSTVDFAKQIRLDILELTYQKSAAFIGSAYSCADIFAVLYTSFMDVDHDTVILSKGHAAVAWYAALCNMGMVEREKLLHEFNTSGYDIGVHPKRGCMPGVTTSTGSLGQGLGLACGNALADRINNHPYHTYAIVGDGECNEGSIWESIMFANRNKLSNLTIFIDRNCLQSYGTDEQVLNLGNLQSKVEAFGLNCLSIDGNDCEQINRALESAHQFKENATVIIANTIKGKGVEEFENQVIWHYKWPEKEHYDRARKELL